MSFQFVHMEAYSRKADRHGRSVGWVLAEAAREPGACPHVANPSAPEVLYGVSPGDVLRRHDEACDVARVTLSNGRTRSLRKDQKTILTVIASHPATIEQARADSAVSADVSAWETRTVAWLRAQYGEGLVSVLRHTDEKHAHIHAYVVPGDLKAMALHPGAAAKRSVVGVGPLGGEDAKALNRRGDEAYKAAMRSWQDSYWQSVGLPCGLTRLGPARRRLSRAEWQAERAASVSVKVARERAAALKEQGSGYVARVRAKTEEMFSAAEAARADAAARAEAAKHLHATAVEKERQAKSLLSRAQREASQVVAAAREKAARLASVGAGVRSLWDGLRRSRVEATARRAVAADVERERARAAEAIQRVADETGRRQDAERRARDAAEAARATAAERDRARRELDFLRPAQPAPPGMTMGRKMR